jgi:serine/threonine protein kinase
MTESLTGQMIGNVRLEELLGEGAVGVVYRGHHTMLGIDVAVKILKVERHHIKADYYYERFRREAQIAAKLNHPNLVKVRDFGLYNSLPYIVMDLVDGISLQDYLQRRKRSLDERTVLKVLLVVADALSVAHAAGVIHRDLKPANILISKKGQLKVVDLGLARDEALPTITMDQVAIGSPAYLSPEALTPGIKVDHRSDLYSLGVIGYEMAFGTRPYRGDVVQIISGHLSAQARFDLPTRCRPGTIALIKKMMARDSAERPQSAKDVVNEARTLMAASRQVAESSEFATAGLSSQEDRSSSSSQELAPAREIRMSDMAAELVGNRAALPKKRHRGLIWGSVIASVVVLALLGYWLSRAL